MNEPRAKRRVIPIKQQSSCGTVKLDEIDQRLARDGWLAQSTIGEPKLSELVGTYKKLGYEVHLEPYQPSADDGPGAEGLDLSRVYVRKVARDDTKTSG